MGTRHLLAVYDEAGKLRIAQYGHYDGYPEGAGLELYRKLSNMDFDVLNEKLNRCRFIKADVVDEVVKNLRNNYPSIHERYFVHSVDILTNVYDSIVKVIPLENSITFAEDSLFCEFAYVVDLSKRTFELYEGFQTENHTGGRFSRPGGYIEGADGTKYYPVIKRTEFDLDALPYTEQEFLGAVAEAFGAEEMDA